MKRNTFLISGVLSLLIVISGFLALFYNNLLSLLLIALGFVTFTIVLRKAKKEDWFGKRV
ncbi:MAG: hypothetical protein V1839_00145 [archaeon]